MKRAQASAGIAVMLLLGCAAPGRLAPGAATGRPSPPSTSQACGRSPSAGQRARTSRAPRPCQVPVTARHPGPASRVLSIAAGLLVRVVVSLSFPVLA
jgi:hypothetical protein